MIKKTILYTKIGYNRAFIIPKGIENDDRFPFKDSVKYVVMEIKGNTLVIRKLRKDEVKKYGK
jgi:hypothetical protein